MKIAIEGMDGVGKTSVAKELAKRNNFTYVDNAIHKLFGIENKDSSFYKYFQSKEDDIFLRCGNDILRAWLCSLGNIYTSSLTGDIVVDRHILSNFQQNGTRENIKIFQTLVELIGKPDMSVILYASPEVRLSRIYNRNKNDKDLNDKNIKTDEYRKMVKFAEKFGMPYIIIDTEEKDVSKIVEEIEKKIILKSKGEIEDEER